MPRPQFQQRHQDYVLGPVQDSKLHSIPSGVTVTGIQLQLDVDAPFLLRGRAMRVAYQSVRELIQSGVEGVALRYAGPDQDWRMQGFIPQTLVMPYGGQGGAWKPVYPQIFYPAGAVLQVEVQNASANDITDLTLYWRGVKLYTWGTNPDYTYPKRMKAIPFAYPIAPIDTANPGGFIQNLLATDTRNRQIFQVLSDADFVLRYGQAGPSFAPQGAEVSVTLRDEADKPYSNAPVHVEVLFGPSIGNFITGGSFIHAIGTGNAVAPTFFPEIYIPANHQLYYDIVRNDGGIGGVPIPNYPITLIGSKVYPL